MLSAILSTAAPICTSAGAFATAHSDTAIIPLPVPIPDRLAVLSRATDEWQSSTALYDTILNFDSTPSYAQKAHQYSLLGTLPALKAESEKEKDSDKLILHGR